MSHLKVRRVYFDKCQGELIYHYYEDGSVASIENWVHPLRSRSYCIDAVEFHCNGNIKHFYMCEFDEKMHEYNCDGKYLNVSFDINGVVTDIRYESSNDTTIIASTEYGAHWNPSMLEKFMENVEICLNFPY